MLAPLLLLGNGLGNKGFDMESSGLDLGRYIQFVYLAGKNVELDAVEGVYFNRPPKPASNSEHWKFLVSEGVHQRLVDHRRRLPGCRQCPV